MDLPNEETIRAWLLADFYRLRHYGRDRRGEDMGEVDWATGLPKNARDLKPTARSIVGTELAMKCPVLPQAWSEAHLGLTFKPKADWDNEDVWTHSEMTSSLKRVIRKLAEEGCFVERPDSPWDGQPMALGQDGYTCYAHITYKGLEEAERVVLDDRWRDLKRGPVSILADAPPEVRAMAPQWAQDQLKAEQNRTA